jgi:hypothetical protein
MKEHINFPRKANSTIVVGAAGHDTVAYFDRGTGYQGITEAFSYRRFLSRIGYTPTMYEVAEFDAMVSAGVL